jgi:uncharacterized coiled-coil protein SlyX
MNRLSKVQATCESLEQISSRLTEIEMKVDDNTEQITLLSQQVRHLTAMLESKQVPQVVPPPPPYSPQPIRTETNAAEKLQKPDLCIRPKSALAASSFEGVNDLGLFGTYKHPEYNLKSLNKSLDAKPMDEMLALTLPSIFGKKLSFEQKLKVLHVALTKRLVHWNNLPIGGDNPLKSGPSDFKLDVRRFNNRGLLTDLGGSFKSGNSDFALDLSGLLEPRISPSYFKPTLTGVTHETWVGSDANLKEALELGRELGLFNEEDIKERYDGSGRVIFWCCKSLQTCGLSKYKHK